MKIADSKKAPKGYSLHRTTQQLKLEQMLLYIAHGSLLCCGKPLCLAGSSTMHEFSKAQVGNACMIDQV